MSRADVVYVAPIQYVAISATVRLEAVAHAILAAGRLVSSSRLPKRFDRFLAEQLIHLAVPRCSIDVLGGRYAAHDPIVSERTAFANSCLVRVEAEIH